MQDCRTRTSNGIPPDANAMNQIFPTTNPRVSASAAVAAFSDTGGAMIAQESLRMKYCTPPIRALHRTIVLVSIVPSLLATISACSTEAWYEGAKRSAEQQCRQQPPNAVDECLGRVNQSRYDRYEKERTTQQR